VIADQRCSFLRRVAQRGRRFVDNFRSSPAGVAPASGPEPIRLDTNEIPIQAFLDRTRPAGARSGQGTWFKRTVGRSSRRASSPSLGLNVRPAERVIPYCARTKSSAPLLEISRPPPSRRNHNVPSATLNLACSQPSAIYLPPDGPTPSSSSARWAITGRPKTSTVRGRPFHREIEHKGRKGPLLPFTGR